MVRQSWVKALSVFCICIVQLTAVGQDRPEPDTEQPAATATDQTDLKPKAPPEYATGRVFLDTDGDGIFGENDQPFVNVKVSDGKEITTTDAKGNWRLPKANPAIYFVIKPSGYQSPLSDTMLPQFYYIHKPAGSPKLRFPGSEPTGPLPDSIDFALHRTEEAEEFKILLFGDPQPRNNREVDYIAHDVIADLIGDRSATFGVTLGDLAFDNLDTFKTLNQAVAMIGIPWHNVIGNHDINLDAADRQHVNETFEATYGPSYYSFDYGQVHFVVMDNIDWGKVNRRQRHIPNFGERQIEFLKNDLAAIPESQMVVLLMHVPINDCRDHQKIFRLIEKRPLCVSVSAHRHVHQHIFLGKDDGWKGDNEHHHIVNVTVSGAWWSGAKNDRGIPHTTMPDGAPNGYSIMSFENGRYLMDFRGAGLPASEQMLVQLQNTVQQGEQADFRVNVYNGSSKSKVEFTIDNSGHWQAIDQEQAFDPNYVRMRDAESKVTPLIQPALNRPAVCSHLWKGKTPTDLNPGTHLLRIRTTDMHGRVFYGQRSFRVSAR